MKKKMSRLLRPGLIACFVVMFLFGAAAVWLKQYQLAIVEFALTALFVTIFVEQWLSTKKHGPAIVGVVTTTLSLLIFGKDVFLIPSMAAIAACLTMMRKTGKEEIHA